MKNAEEVISTNLTPTEKLQQIIQSFVKVFDLYKPHISVFYQESTYLKPKYENAIKSKRNKYRNLIFEVLEEGMRIGEFRKELPVTITGMSILGMVNWTYKWYRVDGGKSIEEIASIYTDLILHAIWTEEAKCYSAYESLQLKSIRSINERHSFAQYRPISRSENKGGV